MQRRRALRLLGALAGIPALPVFARFSETELLALGARVHEALGTAAEPRVLSPTQYRAVEIAAEHIIPRTDTPGATDARVADFVDTMLADWYAPAERDRFLAGLVELDARARREAGRSFADADAPRRVALLTALDGEVTTLRRADPRAADQHWFAMLKFLTAWGFCTSRVGMLDVLRVDPMPGRYDGDAPLRT